MLLAMQNNGRHRSRSAPTTLARLPPLTSLRAFVAAARQLSFVRAAEELHVTSAAIGQQVRQLEDHLGQPLFLRHRGQLVLTEAGQALMPGLTDAFDRVLDAVARLSEDTETAPIRISVAPSFASKWLVPRLAALRKTLPELEVLVDASARLVDLANDDSDCVIRYGLGSYPGLAVDRLFGEAVVPVCSPAFAVQHGLRAGPSALADAPLLHEDGPERDPSCPDWSAWLRGTGKPLASAAPGFRFNQSSLIIDAAIEGQGSASQNSASPPPISRLAASSCHSASPGRWNFPISSPPRRTRPTCRASLASANGWWPRPPRRAPRSRL